MQLSQDYYVVLHHRYTELLASSLLPVGKNTYFSHSNEQRFSNCDKRATSGTPATV
jgi:hypothetical protein